MLNFKTNECVSKVYRKIISRHGRVKNIKIYTEEPPQEGDTNTEGELLSMPPELTDKMQQLHEVFGSFGEEVKADAPEFTLHYDFQPFDSDEPLLFALGVYSPEKE
ncbi:unnamed protein product [Moneuplotes crassus]|uniref:Uncharacterized protein n=1 Tax=Euplotes crassus TaxID=5936 RepID=A0AAD1XRL7_EUPCR|nr:unnamed protein product [Moneuplotes crassus]